MEIETFIQKFVDIFDETDITSLTPDTKFRELDEWSSLTALGVIAFADEEYGVEISGQEIQKASTIQDLYDIIVTKNA